MVTNVLPPFLWFTVYNCVVVVVVVIPNNDAYVTLQQTTDDLTAYNNTHEHDMNLPFHLFYLGGDVCTVRNT